VWGFSGINFYIYDMTQITFYEVCQHLVGDEAKAIKPSLIGLPCLKDINSTEIISSRQIALKYAEQFVATYGQSMWIQLGDKDENIFTERVVRFYPIGNRLFNNRKTNKK